MATNDEAEVKDIDVVNVAPAGDDEENVEEPETTDPESSPEETPEEGDEPAPAANIEKNPAPAAPAPAAVAAPAQVPVGLTEDDLKEVPGETPRERALRLEVTRLRRTGRADRAAELLNGDQPAPAAKPELSEEKKKVLGKYKPEEIAALREAIDVLADDMGFVRKDALTQSTYVEKANDELNTFLEKHSEYLPEKDPNGTLWNAFKTEYALYKQPSDPKDFKKIFERVHATVFGIKPGGNLPKQNAQREKINVASHTGNSPAAAPAPTSRRSAAPQGLRLDMLKGFDQDEIDDMSGGE